MAILSILGASLSPAKDSPHKLDSYVPEIDGLRAVAVLSVILYHLHASFLPGGFTGVDDFFVISGYVVSRTLARDAGSGITIYLQRFYARRFLRILPALLCCLLVTVALTAIFIPEAWLSDTIQKTGLFAFFGVSNFALQAADSYFSPRPAFNPFTHTWSLAVEEQFYLFYPLVLFVYLRSSRCAGAFRIAARAIIPTLLLASLLGLWLISKRSPEAAFYMLPYRFWELAAGALCFQLEYGAGLRLPQFTSHLLAAIGATLIAAADWFASMQGCPMPWSLPAVAGSFLILISLQASATPNGLLGRLLGNPVLVQIGKWSYSLYLWHWPTFVMFRWTIGLYSAADMAAAVVLTFALAYISYSCIEQPFRRNRWIRTRGALAVLMSGVACALLFWGTARYLYASEYEISQSVVMRHSADWYPAPPVPQQSSACEAQWQVQFVGALAVQTVHFPCNTSGANRRLFVIGDSHAAAYSQMLLMLAEAEHMDVRIYTESGCTYANLLNPSYPSCVSFVRSVTARVLKSARRGDAVFLASLRMPRLADQYAEKANSIRDVIAWEATPWAVTERERAYRETVDLVGKFVAKDLTVILDAPKPIFAAAAFRCADWYDRENPMCSGLTVPRRELLEMRQPVMDSLAKLTAAFPNVAIWDPFPVLCHEDVCQAVTPAGPLFFDGDHLSNIGNRDLYPNFKIFIDHVLLVAANVTKHG